MIVTIRRVPHQLHAYQSWQNSPACAIFLNRPQTRRWYLSFKDGGYGGPTEDEPYYVAVELKGAFKLTHFTLTTAGDMPGRDPSTWAIQGSNTGEDDDWTDIYVRDVNGRSGPALRAAPRMETTLYTSFTSGNMAKIASPSDVKKIKAKLTGKEIAKADFSRQAKAYTWFRIAIYSCFNPNSMTVQDAARPSGCHLGQLELFGVSGVREHGRAKPLAEVRPPVYDAPFIISYWCGPPKSETTLERYKEIAECGFNVAMPPVDWPPDDAANKKILDLCQQVGIKAIIHPGMPLGDGSAPKPEEIPKIEKALDAVAAKFSSHPALLGYYVADEPGVGQFARLGVINRYLLKKDPKHLPYINILPNYAAGGWSTGYRRRVRQYINAVGTPLLSWDHYRQMFGDNGDESYYWRNLEIVREQCLKAKIPYIQIIVSLKHMGYRECSEADLRWQVYTSLAYGSRGILYFTYWDVKELAWAGAPAIMTLDGKRDVKYEYVKRINNRIAKLGPTLVKLVSTGAYCTDPAPPGGRRLAGGAPVKKAEGGPLLIGCFKDPEGKQYVMVVNRSFRNKIAARLTTDKKIISAAEVSRETGKLLAAKVLTDKVFDVTLDAGDGRLFFLADKGLTYRPPDEIFGGRDIELSGITFTPKKTGARSTGKLFWRKQGGTKFAGLPLKSAEKNRYTVTVPASITKAPFEYYIEMQEAGEKPVLEPNRGPEAPSVATPDLTPPTAVAGLAAPVAKSYRVTLRWEPAADDRKVVEYRVHRGTADKFPPAEKTLLAKLSADALEYTDNAPTPKQTAWYAVQAIDIVGREGAVRYFKVDVPDHQPPANTLKLKATPGSKSVMLAWSGSDELEPIVNAIEIHRGEGKDGALAKISEIAELDTTQYVDKDTKFGTEYRYAVRPRSNAGLLGEFTPAVTASPLRYLKRINCGGPEVTAEDGAHWEADIEDGHAALVSAGTSTWTVRGAVKNTGKLKGVYQTERWANRYVQYAFKVDPGRYEVVLLFAETNDDFFGKGKRTFDIRIGEKVAAEKADVFAEAGAAMTPWVFRKTVDVAGRELRIGLHDNPIGPAIKGIEIRGLPAK